MPNAGYAAVSRTMHWRMYGGHNCTNYVAYRMVRSGLPDRRPWTGSGNAANWGLANRRLTNRIPAVGAVAWWGSHAHPAGAAGHVAYVERVVSSDQIVVSQDSWGGDFSWRSIPRGGGSWPTGFIHFNDVPLANTVTPAVQGTPRVGRLLRVSPGSWSPSPTTTTVQWLADGIVIPGAAQPVLRLTEAQQSRRISAVVTASRTGYPTTGAASTSTLPVAPSRIKNLERPAVSGDPQIGRPLTATPGRWAPIVDITYRWSADGAPLPHATTSTLTPGAPLLGKRLTVTTTASRSGYAAATATSSVTQPVSAGTISVTRAAGWAGVPHLGRQLRLDPGGFSPSGAYMNVQWLRSGVPIRSASGTTLRLSPADLGHRIRVRTTLVMPGYRSTTSLSPPTRRVTTVPRLKVVARPGRARMVVTSTLTAAGVSPVTGSVGIRVNGRTVRDVVLRHGAITVTLHGLPAGRTRIRVHYRGSTTVSPATRLVIAATTTPAR